MALSAEDRIKYQLLVVPLLVPYLRQLRAAGFDARATAEARWDSGTASQLAMIAQIVLRSDLLDDAMSSGLPRLASSRRSLASGA